jgi:hypothetical protein
MVSSEDALRRSLRERLVEAVAPLLATVTPGRYRDVAPSDRLDVDGFLAADAASCPARAASRVPTPFTPSPRTVARAAGRSSYLEVLAGGASPSGTPSVSAHEGYRRARELARSSEEADYPWDWLAGLGSVRASSVERTASAAATLTFTARLARVLEPFGALSLAPRGNAIYPHPGGYPVRFTGRVDFVEATGDGRRIVLLASGVPGPRQLPKVAFEALLDSLCFPLARSVLLLLPDAGEHEELAVDEALLDTGIAVATSGLEVAIARSAGRGGELARRPSSGCRYCPALADCSPGGAWLIAAGILGRTLDAAAEP